MLSDYKIKLNNSLPTSIMVNYALRLEQLIINLIETVAYIYRVFFVTGITFYGKITCYNKNKQQVQLCSGWR